MEGVRGRTSSEGERRGAAPTRLQTAQGASGSRVFGRALRCGARQQRCARERLASAPRPSRKRNLYEQRLVARQALRLANRGEVAVGPGGPAFPTTRASFVVLESTVSGSLINTAQMATMRQ